ncbi:DUF881 domain-containing protein [Paenisporosarcina cavernae]|uniref:DUF881 domain-containing protein n=1 Tax=Paenisporosarcina cavernae TaxID=2320858 RepID=A0A385YXX2_9BACL|nr:DUF881 domain-containing protein [Paenisporosarcina cavernae]AYC30767.1 DUF881 domain-containing protein [Paenisporosarcina cavernae]
MKVIKRPANRYVLWALVCVVFGFILSYSYSISNDKNTSSNTVSSTYYEQQERYRELLIEQKERNKELTDELEKKQTQVREIEQQLSGSEESYDALVKEAEDLRLLLGTIPVEGEGVSVLLEDEEYSPETQNPNDYIVHESHIFMVVNELKISGAEAISINGKRIAASSYIKCTGPVITVDGQQFPAPFEIKAIGDPNVLLPALKLSGGILDQLVNDNIVVTVEEKEEIKMSSL